MVRPNGQAPRTMEELCQPSINGRGGPNALIPIQATDFGLRHHMIQQVQNTCQFHGLPGDDANRHIDKFLEITQHMKQNGVSDDALLTQLDTFYNGLTLSHQDTINATVGGTFMQKTPEECYELIENMTAHHNHWDTSVIQDETSRNISSASTTETVDTKCETCGGPYSFTECPAVGGYSQETTYATTGRGNNFNQTPTYQAPTHQSQVVSQVGEFQAYMKANDAVMKNMQTQMTSLTNSNLELKNMFGQFMKINTASSLGTGSLPSNTVPNPREDLKAITTRSGVTLARPSVSPFYSKEVNREPKTITNHLLTESTNNVPPLIVQPSPASTSFSNNSSSKMPEVTKDTLVDCLALADLGASINLMPLSIWEKLSLPELTPTQMILELADRSITRPADIVEDVFVKVGKFHFPTDFVVIDYVVDPQEYSQKVLGFSMSVNPTPSMKPIVSTSSPTLTPFGNTNFLLEETDDFLAIDDESISPEINDSYYDLKGDILLLEDFLNVIDYVVDPRVPLILGRPFLRTERALIDVYGEELTLRVDDDAINFRVGQTLKYSYNDAESINQNDVIDVACDFILEEIEACLTSESIPPGIDDTDLDLEGDIRLLEELLNNDPSLSPPPSKELNVKEIKTIKSSIDEPPELELKDLTSHLEYAYLEGTDKLPVIIAKDLKDDEKEALLKVLKSHKRAIAWKIFDIKGIDPRFCTHKILMEDDYKPTVQSQRRVNPKIHEVIKKEVIKLLDAGMIYPIYDSPWVSPIHYVHTKGGITVVENENNKLIPTRLVTGWRVCIDYQKLNDATRKDHFPLPFMDQIMPFGLCNASGTFQRCMMAIFHDMIEKTKEVFMDDFLVFGDSFSSCLSYLDTMLQWCKDTNLVLNWEKCHFMVKDGIVLGHKISKNRLEVDRAKVDVIAKLPHPTTVKGVRSFLRHAGFYQRFIQDFSKIARPMGHLLEKETPFVFSKNCIDAFETLKKKLTEASILVVPDWNLSFKVMCDASDFAIGAVLRQRKTEHFQPIHYASKTMTEAQIHYTMTEKEMLIIVYAAEKF
nr:DNA-directed DNA polymerase [Tanacetum cinerariifolium]